MKKMNDVEANLSEMCQKAISDESVLRSALKNAEVTPMLLVYTQLSGDDSFIKEFAAHIHGPWSFQQSIPPQKKDRIVDALVGALKASASGKGNPQKFSSPDQMRELMGAAAGREVPAEYIPLLVEEMQFDASANREVHWRVDPATLNIGTFNVVVIGAGISGIIAAIHLKKMGIPFVVYERNSGIGGTWLENSYPGCGVDTPTHFYSFSFAPKLNWSRHFAKRDEILKYIEDVVHQFGIREHIRFNSEVTSAIYDDQVNSWRVDVRDASGDIEHIDARAVISAAGYFNRPSIPDIKGAGDFKGRSFHTARWNHDIDLKGKRVAMIGTGASAMQAAPAIAPDVEHLTIFQRQPHWALYNPNYNKEMTSEDLWAFENIPFYGKWVRFQMFWASGDGFHDSLHRDPDWTQPEVSLNKDNHSLREQIIAHAREELGDGDLLARVIPNFPPYGKRMLRENNWFKTLKRENVTLETQRISHITKNAIVMDDGTEHEVDVLIWATGFTAQRMLWPMDIRGRDGISIRDVWGDDNPSAYLGISTPGFPNLFITAGPNTFWSHGGSMIFASECQVRFILQAIREMLEKDISAIEVRQDVHDKYNESLHKKASDMVWTHPNVNSYYKNSLNRLTVLMPWRLVDYWDMTREFNIDDYTAERISMLKDGKTRRT